MKKSHILSIFIFLGLTIILSACVPGPRVTGSPGIAVTEDYVFVANQFFVYRLDVTSGDVDWQFPEEANNKVVFYAKPLVTEDYVYVGDLANTFHKLDKETGDEIWQFSEAKGYFVGQAAEVDGVVYAPSDDGNLYAIDENGDFLWSFKTGHYLWSQPQVSENAIYLGSMDHFVYAISKEGKEIWSYEMEGAVISSPVLSEDGKTLFAGSIGNDFVALDTSSGEVFWSYTAEGSLWGSPALVNGILYLADDAGNLVALDASDGKVTNQIEFEGSAVGGVTEIDEGVILATEDGSIILFDFIGGMKKVDTLSGEIFQAPEVNDEYIVVGVINGENLLYAYNLAGVQQWSTTPEN